MNASPIFDPYKYHMDQCNNCNVKVVILMQLYWLNLWTEEHISFMILGLSGVYSHFACSSVYRSCQTARMMIMCRLGQEERKGKGFSFCVLNARYHGQHSLLYQMWKYQTNLVSWPSSWCEMTMECSDPSKFFFMCTSTLNRWQHHTHYISFHLTLC